MVLLVEAVLGEFFESSGRSGWSSVSRIVGVSVPVNVQNAPRSRHVIRFAIAACSGRVSGRSYLSYSGK